MRWHARVAIIDDEASIRRAFLRLLRLSGYEPSAYSSVAAFLESFATSRPDCILLDLNLPGESGLDLLRKLNETENTPPVIVVSAGGGDARELCGELGSRAWLQKPVDGATLLDCLRVTLAAKPPA
jgi:two-component system response regulator FixJ